jgi:hypothetical protein
VSEVKLKTSVLILLIILMVSTYGEVFAMSRCALDGLGNPYCSKYSGGTAVQNSLGSIVCGMGECVKDSMGTVECSTEAGGGAILDSLGRAECTNGCETGTSSNCITPSP